MGKLSDVRWGRVLLASIAVFVLNILVAVLVITGYTTLLAFQVQGAPDQASIDAFGSSVAPWVGLVASLVLTFAAARWVVRKVETGKQINGLMVGILVVIGLVPSFSLDLISLLVTALIVVAGWAGGRQAETK